MSARNEGHQLPHEQALRAVLDEGRPEQVAKQHARGKLTARERIALLTDEGSFVEIGALARPEPGPGGKEIPADGIVTGTALIDGRPAVITASDYTAAGGSNGILGNEKARRCIEIAATRGIPLVNLFDGGGHRITEGLDARDFAGGIDIQELGTRLSGWVPVVAAFLGPGYGQPTLSAALADYAVAVRGIATAGMAPPALVKAATGADVDEQALFGADAQASFGTVDLVVDDEEDALLALRVYLATLPPNAEAPLPVERGQKPALEAARRIDDVVPADQRLAYDMHEVIAGLVDEDSQVELKSGFARNVITMIATVDGHPIGIVANQPLVLTGALDAGAADKAAHLVSLCDAFGIPVLVLMDQPGLTVGEAAERSGLARSTGRLSLALGTATVPTFSILVRKGYGGAYVLLGGGRSYRSDVVIAWPHAETGAMSPDSAIDLVFRKDLEAAEDPVARRVELLGMFGDRLGALRGAEGFGFDAVVRPSETRDLLLRALATLPRRKLMQAVTPRQHPVQPL
ncbi:MAG TPA: carboxyl transferase domain-containing protein [Nocardioides sp.]|nr:carboxyl transferase domain-containing protein [Nocardioides sp.]